MKKTGVIILVHGTRGMEGTAETMTTIQKLCAGIGQSLDAGVMINGAAMEFNEPDLKEAVESMVADSINDIVIMPYFLFPGIHITEHIPQAIDELKITYPDVSFTFARTLGIDSHMVELVLSRILEAAPWLGPSSMPWSLKDDNIEDRSMEVIERLAPEVSDYPEEERAIIKRIIHASGDPDLAGQVCFGHSAIEHGIEAIKSGANIVTDVRMVSAGISKSAVIKFGCPVQCSLDMADSAAKKTNGMTRSAAAMRLWGEKLNGAIVAIGNAPTALLSLLEMIDAGEAKPALIIGMPVGFIQAKESKDELMKREVPYISIRGARGGSSLAAATVNALLKIAVERSGQNSR